VLKDAARGVQKDISNIASKLPTAALRIGAKIAQDVGDGISVAGYGLTISGVGAEVGIPLARAGNVISNVGTGMGIVTDFIEGKFEDVGTEIIKTAVIEVGQTYINNKIDKLPGGKIGKEILKQNTDLKIKGADKLYNYIQNKKINEDNQTKVKIEKD